MSVEIAPEFVSPESLSDDDIDEDKARHCLELINCTVFKSCGICKLRTTLSAYIVDGWYRLGLRRGDAEVAYSRKLQSCAHRNTSILVLASCRFIAVFIIFTSIKVEFLLHPLRLVLLSCTRDLFLLVGVWWEFVNPKISMNGANCKCFTTRDSCMTHYTAHGQTISRYDVKGGRRPASNVQPAIPKLSAFLVIVSSHHKSEDNKVSQSRRISLK